MSAPTVLPRISAVLIVKDEEDVLDASLAALGWVDEIVVYDTGSTDSTREIARKYTPNVIEGYWDEDFGAARNRAIAHATCEWVLTVDADEVVAGDVHTVHRKVAASTANLFLLTVSSAEGGGERPEGATVTARIFRQTEYRYAGRLHEQVVPISSTTTPSMEPVANVWLNHSGYTHAAIEKHDKHQRNLRIARRDLEEAIASGAAHHELELHRTNLARSLSAAGEVEEGLALAAAVRSANMIGSMALAELASSAVGAATVLGLDDEVDEWLDVWEASDRSPAWARGVKARILVGRGQPQRALDVLDELPTTLVDSAGRRFVKHTLADVAVVALLQVGRRKEAVRVASKAVEAGFLPCEPHVLSELFPDDAQLRKLVAVVPDQLWRELAVRCGQEASDPGLRVLRAMAVARPGDLTVMLCISGLAPVLGLEDLAVCAADLRRAGLAEICPLVRLSLDPRTELHRRALVAAMAVGIYHDDRATPGLAEALAHVQPEDEAELLMQLEIIAPGLVAAA